jgi:hypothetical protein
LLAGVFRVIGAYRLPILLVQLVIGAAACGLVYDAGRRLFDKPTALAAGIAAAVFGPLVYYECMFMKSFLSPVLTMAALAAGLRYADARRRIWLIVAGASVGLAALVQEHHLLLLLPLAAWAWWCDGLEARSVSEGGKPRGSQPAESGSEGRTSRNPRLRFGLPSAASLAVLFGSALLCVAPAMVRNYAVGRELVLVTAGGGEVFYMAHGPQAQGYYSPPDFVVAAPGEEHEDFRREARRRTGREMTRGEVSRYWFRQGLREMLANPGRELRLLSSKAAILMNDYDVPDSGSYAAAREFITILRLLPGFGWIAGLGLVGAGLCLRHWRRYQLPLGMAAAHIGTVLLVYNFGRLRLGFTPIWILFAAHAAVWSYRAVEKAELRAKMWGLAALVLAAVVTVLSFYPLLADRYELADAKSVAELSIRKGDYTRAGREVQRILDALEQVEGVSGSAQYNAHIITVRELAAEVACQQGQYVDAARQLQLARQIPTRPEARENRLLYEISLLQGVVRYEGHRPLPRELTAEIEAASRELCKLKPGEIAYWAVSSVHVDSPQAAGEVEAGLEQAWAGRKQPNVKEQGWYWLGRAFLAKSHGQPEKSVEASRKALSVWPEHFYRPELEALLREANVPRSQGPQPPTGSTPSAAAR